jgi:hypothetical protein
MRSGSSGSLNRPSRSSSTIRLRTGLMSISRSAISATSFCDCEITTAMSVPRMKAISRTSRSRSWAVSFPDARRSSLCLSRASHAACTFVYVRTAVALSA